MCSSHPLVATCLFVATVPTLTLGELSRVIGVDSGQRIKLVLLDTAGGESLFMTSVPEQ